MQCRHKHPADNEPDGRILVYLIVIDVKEPSSFQGHKYAINTLFPLKIMHPKGYFAITDHQGNLFLGDVPACQKPPFQAVLHVQN